MNTANLQVEGLLIGMAALFAVLKRKGLLSQDDITHALQEAEARALADAKRGGQMREANQQAVVFPIRYLMEATSEEGGRAFRDIAASVGRAKDETSAGA